MERVLPPLRDIKMPKALKKTPPRVPSDLLVAAE